MEIQITPARRRTLADKLGVNEQYLYQCLTGRRDMSPAEAMRIETDTDGELTRAMLCQKTHQAIWPELSAITARAHAPQAETTEASTASAG